MLKLQQALYTHSDRHIAINCKSVTRKRQRSDRTGEGKEEIRGGRPGGQEERRKREEEGEERRKEVI